MWRRRWEKIRLARERKRWGDRWMGLVEEFTGGDPDITTSVGNLYKDRANWPAQFQQQMAPFSNKQVWGFMREVLAKRK